MRIPITKLIILLTILFKSSESSEVDPLKQPHAKTIPFIWIDLLGGPMNSGISVGAKLSVDPGITIAYETMAYSDCFIMCNQSEKLTESNILVGKRLNHGALGFFASIGFGLISGDMPNGSYDDGIDIHYYSKSFNSYGIPFEFGGSISKYIGIGITFHGNINNKIPVLGVNLDFPIGYIN